MYRKVMRESYEVVKLFQLHESAIWPGPTVKVLQIETTLDEGSDVVAFESSTLSGIC
jgi:hypothetical protein